MSNWLGRDWERTATYVLASPPGASEPWSSLRTTGLHPVNYKTPRLHLSRSYRSVCCISSTLRGSRKHLHLHHWPLNVHHIAAVSLCCGVRHPCLHAETAVQLWAGPSACLLLSVLSCKTGLVMPAW